MKDKRPTFPEHFMRGAQWASERGECRRRQVGAVLVDSRNRVRGVGWNGTIDGLPNCLEGACPRGHKSKEEVPPGTPYTDCIATHAEENLLRNTAKEHVKDSIVYVSEEPCERCITLLKASGVAEVYWTDGGFAVL